MSARDLPKRVFDQTLWMLAGALLAGCVSAPMAAHPYEAGWRLLRYVGTPDQIVAGARLQLDCRAQPHPSDQRFALLLERHRRSQFMTIDRYWVVPVGSGVQLRAGEEVFARGQDCSASADPAYG